MRALCAGFPGRYWRELDQRREYPAQFVDEFARAGWFGALVPAEFGGSGLGLMEATAVLEEVHRSGCNAGALHAQMYTLGSLLASGDEEQKARWLPGIATGDLRLQAFGVSEPNNGSDTLALETTARRASDGSGDWIISGQKQWTSRAEHSDLMLVLARTAGDDDTVRDGSDRTTALTLFLVDLRGRTAGSKRTSASGAHDATQEGGAVSITPVRTSMNHSTTSVFLDNVRVGSDAVIGGVGNGFRVVLQAMNAERTLIAAECIGDGHYFVDTASKYASERVVFGRPIGTNQAVSLPIAKAYTEVMAASLMVRRAAALYDARRPCAVEANTSKLLAADASWAAAEAAVQTLGGNGFAAEYDVERKWREARLYRVAPISSNLVLTYVAEKVLGMPRSY